MALQSSISTDLEPPAYKSLCCLLCAMPAMAVTLQCVSVALCVWSAWQDGFGGDTLIERNLFFASLLETSDHGVRLHIT